jgi:hypothetical protein
MALPLLGGRSCRSCVYRRLFDQAVFCYRYPPVVVVVPTPDGRGGVAVGFQSVYPQVNPDMPCGEYARSESLAAEEVRQSVLGETRQ